MKNRIFSFCLLLFLTFMFTAGTVQAEELHNWYEPNPYHPWDTGRRDSSGKPITEDLFYTYTRKLAHLTEYISPYGPGTFWQVMGYAMASANCQPSSPRPGDRSREWNAIALLRTTGDNDILTPHSGDGLPKRIRGNPRYEWSEITLRSADGTTVIAWFAGAGFVRAHPPYSDEARTVRKAHPVFYKNQTWGPVQERYLDESVSASKSDVSTSSPCVPTHPNPRNPWASARLDVERRINLAAPLDGSPFISETPDCSSSGAGHT